MEITQFDNKNQSLLLYIPNKILMFSQCAVSYASHAKSDLRKSKPKSKQQNIFWKFPESFAVFGNEIILSRANIEFLISVDVQKDVW